MTWRLDVSARLLMTLLCSLMLLGIAGVLLLHVREQGDEAVGYTTRYPRIAQVAAIVDLLARAPPQEVEPAVRAANGVDLSARLSLRPPAQGMFVEAPKLEGRLASFSQTRTTVRAYTHPLYKPRDPSARVEGFLARAVARLPDGRYLTLQAHRGMDEEQPRLFGVGASLWLGGLALLLSVGALWAVEREMRPLRALVQAVEGFDGEAVTVAAPTTRSEDVRRTALAVISMQERVVELLGERALIIGAISHDLRTLLTKMRLRTASLAETQAQSGLEADLEDMEAMLADGLAFARGVASGAARVPLDLADLVAAELADRQARHEPVAIEAVLEDTPVLGDPPALRRVVANLLDNAVKYGGGRVRISARPETGGGELIVEDDGPGIRPDQREAVLRPYGRGDDPRRRGLAGSGLGLAIVQQIVRGHSGGLSITGSDLGGARIVARFGCETSLSPSTLHPRQEPPA